MANAACHYALFLNRGWLDLWESYLDDYLDAPKRFVNAQTACIEQAFDHYQESMQQLGSLATKATRDARSAVRATEAERDRAACQFQSETTEMGWGNRPKENPMPGGGEERREQAQQAAYGVRLR